MLLVAGCVGAKGPATALRLESAPKAMTSSSLLPPQELTAPSSPAASAQVAFERLAVPPPPDPLPHVEILFPYTGRVVPAVRVDDYEVRLRVEHWSGRVQLALDDLRPIVLDESAEPVSLASLVPADRDLAPGSHRLFAVAIDEQGRMVRPVGPNSRGPYSVVEFRVASRAPLAKERPFLAYSQPRGTYNGDEAADAVFVDFYLVDTDRFPGSRVRVDVSGRGGSWSETLENWQPVGIRGLPSGDFDVELTLVDEGGAAIKAVSAVARTISVNRDAPVPPDPSGGGR